MQVPTCTQFDDVLAARVRVYLDEDRLDEALQTLSPCRAETHSSRLQLALLRCRAFTVAGETIDAISAGLAALRGASRVPELRSRARLALANAYLRDGNLHSVERVALRALCELRRESTPDPLEPRALLMLAAVQRRRGQLSLVRQLCERAIDLAASIPNDDEIRLNAGLSLGLALIHMAEFDRARYELDRIRPRMSDRSSPRTTSFHLAMALLALHVNRLDDCGRALAQAGEASTGGGMRRRVILGEYSADLLIARGRAAEAVEPLRKLLSEVHEAMPMGDLVPEVARRLAHSLFESGRPQEALPYADLADRMGRRADPLESIAALRISGLCLIATGDVAAARLAFNQANSLLDVTEFHAERRRLEAAIASVQTHPTNGRPTFGEPQSRATRQGDGLICLKLRDGRELHTSAPELVERLQVAARDDIPVLISGDTGTGKELVARLIHDLGAKHQKPFVVVDCSTLTESLAEAELFGCLRGAFSGAVSDRGGLVAAAEGGTLFFDELPELSLSMQAKLLRLFQNKTYRRVGDAVERKSCVRVIAATNRDPDRLVSESVLKRDLFHRLNGHRFHLPPLCDRPGEIAGLARLFALRCGLQGVSREALIRLETMNWSGNVRELELLIQVSARFANASSWLDVGAIGRALAGRSRPGRLDDSLHDVRARAEREQLLRTLEAHGGNRSSAGKSLGMTRQGFSKALKRNDIV